MYKLMYLALNMYLSESLMVVSFQSGVVDTTEPPSTHVETPVQLPTALGVATMRKIAESAVHA